MNQEQQPHLSVWLVSLNQLNALPSTKQHCLRVTDPCHVQRTASQESHYCSGASTLVLGREGEMKASSKMINLALSTYNLAETLVSGEDASSESTNRVCLEVWVSHYVRQDVD